MITLVNFADNNFKNNQKWNSFTAKFFGEVDKIFEYGLDDIDTNFLELNKGLLKYSKGFGNYFWKPYIINKALSGINEGDYLMYADSGSIFLKSVKPMVKHMESKNKKILCFKLPLIEKQWTKKDTFILMDCDSELYSDSSQSMGGFILIKKCKESIDFLSEFQKYCLDERIISDAPNTLGFNNAPEFIAHRHDQSVLSLLCKKHNVILEGDLSDYGVFPSKYLYNKDYLFDSGRLNPENNIFKGTVLCNRKVHPIEYAIKYYMKLLLSNLSFKI